MNRMRHISATNSRKNLLISPELALRKIMQQPVFKINGSSHTMTWTDNPEEGRPLNEQTKPTIANLAEEFASGSSGRGRTVKDKPIESIALFPCCKKSLEEHGIREETHKAQNGI